MRLRLGNLRSSPSASKRRGLGDLLKAASTALGIKPCGGCDERAEKLNILSGKPKK